MGYAYIHSAVDDYSRLAYSEMLADERKQTRLALGDGPGPGSWTTGYRWKRC